MHCIPHLSLQNISIILSHSSDKSIPLILDNILENGMVPSALQCGSTFQRLQFISGIYGNILWVFMDYILYSIKVLMTVLQIPQHLSNDAAREDKGTVALLVLYKEFRGAKVLHSVQWIPSTINFCVKSNSYRDI